MTHTQEQFNPEQEAILQYVPDFQATTFTIVGDGAALQDMAADIQALEAAQPTETVKHASRLAKPVIEAVRASSDHFLGRVATDIKTVAYDKVHGTDFYGALRQKREDERNLRFATSIGLISLHDVTCRKHEAAIAKMRGL